MSIKLIFFAPNARLQVVPIFPQGSYSTRENHFTQESGVIFTRARVSLALLSRRKSGDYSQSIPMPDRKTDFLTFNKSSCYSWPRGYEKINHHEPKRHQWNKIVKLIWTAHYQAQNSYQDIHSCHDLKENRVRLFPKDFAFRPTQSPLLCLDSDSLILVWL